LIGMISINPKKVRGGTSFEKRRRDLQKGYR
jgi:hypothetical protein